MEGNTFKVIFGCAWLFMFATFFIELLSDAPLLQNSVQLVLLILVLAYSVLYFVMLHRKRKQNNDERDDG